MLLVCKCLSEFSVEIIFLSCCYYLKMPSFRQKSTSSEFYKNYTVGPIFESGSWEYLGRTRGTHHAPTPHGGAAGPWPRQGMVWGPPGPPPLLPPTTSSSCPTKDIFIQKLVFLLFIFHGFWSTCSAHLCCWDLEHLFFGMWLLHSSKWNFVWWIISWVFAVVGDRLSEFACLFYARLISFDACLALLQVDKVVPLI